MYLFDSLGSANIKFVKAQTNFEKNVWQYDTYWNFIVVITGKLNNYSSLLCTVLFFLPKRKFLNNSQPRAILIDILSILGFSSVTRKYCWQDKNIPQTGWAARRGGGWYIIFQWGWGGFRTRGSRGTEGWPRKAHVGRKSPLKWHFISHTYILFLWFCIGSKTIHRKYSAIIKPFK